jgi:hypothetical protein
MVVLMDTSSSRRAVPLTEHLNPWDGLPRVQMVLPIIVLPQPVEEVTTLTSKDATVTSKDKHFWEDDRCTFDPWDRLPQVQMVLLIVYVKSNYSYQQVCTFLGG